MAEDKEQTFEIFYCDHCKVLLFKMDEKIVEYDACVLDERGCYEFRDAGEKDHDYWLCPICSASDNEDEREDRGGVLKAIDIPVRLATPLIEMWNKMEIMYNSGANEEGDECEDGYIYEYGIPLNQPELKELLVEYLI